MKNRHITETDLANIASIPFEQRRSQLEKLEENNVFWNYNPSRLAYLDIFNCMPELFGPSTPSSWDQIGRVIATKSKSSDELKYNLLASKALHTYSLKNRILSRKAEFFPITFSNGLKVSLWSPLVFVSQDRPVIPFIDPRLSKRLTPSGRRFAFSAMHERIRALEPDYEDSRLLVIQLKKTTDADAPRVVVDHYENEISLMSYEEMDQSVVETYQIWQEIKTARTEKRRAAGGGGSLL